jgi:parallel beta-helix repeat protein
MKKVTYYLMALFITLVVSAATLEAATVITSLPYTITTQGSYIINQNLTANWNGIKVQANNVTIDLNGYSIVGNNSSGGYGIYMNGRSNVEIRNGTIRNFGSTGIYEEGSFGNSHRVINVRVMNNKVTGIILAGSNHMVKDCTVSNNKGVGIYIWYGSTISGNTVYDNGANGISAIASSSVIGNTVYSNQGSGIVVGSGSTVKNNTVNNNDDYGIYLSAQTLVDGNTAYNNNQSGGASTNMNSCLTCVFGDNVAP